MAGDNPFRLRRRGLRRSVVLGAILAMPIPSVPQHAGGDFPSRIETIVAGLLGPGSALARDRGSADDMKRGMAEDRQRQEAEWERIYNEQQRAYRRAEAERQRVMRGQSAWQARQEQHADRSDHSFGGTRSRDDHHGAEHGGWDHGDWSHDDHHGGDHSGGYNGGWSHDGNHYQDADDHYDSHGKSDTGDGHGDGEWSHDSTDGDGEGDGKGRGGSNSGSGGGRSDRGNVDGGRPNLDERPPSTVAEALRRIMKSSKQSNERTPAANLEFEDIDSFMPRELIATNLQESSRARLKANNFKITSRTDLPNLGMTVERVVVPAGMDMAAARELLKSEVPNGQFAPNRVYRIYKAAEGDGEQDQSASAPEGACGDRCFSRTLINWKPSLRSCARRVRVGVIDTAFDLTHPAFAGHRFNSGSFLGETPSKGRDWHGTAVLSVLAGDPASGTPGLVPDAEFFLASAFRTDEAGNATTDTISLLKSLEWLDALDVRLVNMSFAGPRDGLLEGAIKRLHAKGTVFVAAAGNQGPGAAPAYPAAYSEVIAVTAVSRELQSYRHANQGSYVDVAAPGVDVWAALPDGRQGYRTGTSFAAPVVTGVIAVSPEARRFGSDKARLLAAVAYRDLGTPGRDQVYGQGLVQAPDHCVGPPVEVAREKPPAAAPVAAPSATPPASVQTGWAPASVDMSLGLGFNR